MPLAVRHYQTRSGRVPFQAWLDRLEDLQGRIAILRRIDQLVSGLPGDHRYLREGVWELRISLGPGYRCYYGRHGADVVVLLTGGSKHRQASDIRRAVRYWRDYLERL